MGKIHYILISILTLTNISCIFTPQGFRPTDWEKYEVEIYDISMPEVVRLVQKESLHDTVLVKIENIAVIPSLKNKTYAIPLKIFDDSLIYNGISDIVLSDLRWSNPNKVSVPFVCFFTGLHLQGEVIIKRKKGKWEIDDVRGAFRPMH